MEPISTGSSLNLLDLKSIGWIVMISALTGGSLAVKMRFEAFAAAGRFQELLANVVIAYFGIAMTLFGTWAAVRASLPIPGGAAWEGPVAVIGGLAALTSGASTSSTTPSI